MICISAVVLFIVILLFNHFCGYGANNFWDKVYDITEWAVYILGFIAGFELFFTLIFFSVYQKSISTINNLYEDIYALEPYLNETRIVLIAQSKIDEYESEKEQNIIFGCLTGFDVSEFKAFPTLSISNDCIIVES